MTRLRHVLVFEYLLADSRAWQSASESMKNEAAAMLTALTADISRLPDALPVVMLSSAAAAMLKHSEKLKADIPVIVSDQPPTDWLASPSVRPESFEASLIIAPECGGILSSLLHQLQTGDWQTVRSANVSSAASELFGDKLQTCRWLEKNGISTPDTRSLNDDEASCWLQNQVRTGTDTEQSSEKYILKPRDGAGSDQISVCNQSERVFDSLATFPSTGHSWIVQPYLEGTACSIGLIGGGTERPALLLPPAYQNIREFDGQLRYCGGRILRDAPFAAAVRDTAFRLAEATGPFRGYLGIDMIATSGPDGDVKPHVIEINPRLCTSYIGYRSLLTGNLAGMMLDPAGTDRLEFRGSEVEFDTTSPWKDFVRVW